MISQKGFRNDFLNIITTENLKPSWEFTQVEMPNVLFMQMSEGSGDTTADNSGNGHTGTIIGATWTKGRIGSALSFDGIDDNVNVGDASDLNFDVDTPFTIVAWIKPLATGFRPIFAKIYSSDNFRGYMFSQSRYTLKLYLIYDLDNYIDVASSTAPIILNQWQHVAVTYDGSGTASGVNFYWNGQLLGTTIYKDNVIKSIQTPLNARIGSREDAGFFKGLIDQVGVYNRALTKLEIMALYKLS